MASFAGLAAFTCARVAEPFELDLPKYFAAVFREPAV